MNIFAVFTVLAADRFLYVREICKSVNRIITRSSKNAKKKNEYRNSPANRLQSS